MTSYEELEFATNINEIEEVYYNKEFKLDLKQTLELMKETSIDDFDSCIEFYGKDFKVSLFQLGYQEEPAFIEISLARPSSTEVHKPFTVDASETKYSKEYRKNIPFMTDQMVKDEKESKQKAIEEEKRRKEEQNQKEINYIKEKEEFATTSDDITEEDLFQLFKGGTYGNNAYITVPYFPNNTANYQVSDENFLASDVRNTIDFVGYAVKVNGQFRVFARKSLYMIGNDDTQNERHYHDVMDRLQQDGKIIPILGIADEYVSDYPEDIFKNNLKDIKEYFER